MSSAPEAFFDRHGSKTVVRPTTDPKARAKIALQTVDPRTLAGKPIAPTRFAFGGQLFPRQAVSMLAGQSGFGKSQLMVQGLMAAATGGDLFGLAAIPCNCLAIFSEDSLDEIHARLARTCSATGIELADLGRLRISSRVGMDNVMTAMDPATRMPALTPFFAHVMETALDHQARLIVLDSKHDFYALSENDRGLARWFTGRLREIAIECDAAVVLLDHPSRAGLADGSLESGSTAWRAAVRQFVVLDAPDPEDREARSLRVTKSNYTSGDLDIRLRMSGGVLTAEEPAPSGYVGAIDRSNRETHAEAIFLACLKTLADQGRYVSDRVRASNYAPRLIAQLPSGKSIKTDALRAAMERLFERGAIEIGPAGRDAYRRPVDGIRLKTPGPQA